jgi:hypothetical protein
MKRSAFGSLLVERAGRQDHPCLACDALFASVLDGATLFSILQVVCYM